MQFGLGYVEDFLLEVQMSFLESVAVHFKLSS